MKLQTIKWETLATGYERGCVNGIMLFAFSVEPADPDELPSDDSTPQDTTILTSYLPTEDSAAKTTWQCIGIPEAKNQAALLYTQFYSKTLGVNCT